MPEKSGKISEKAEKPKEKSKTRVTAVKRKLKAVTQKVSAPPANKVSDGLELLITIVNRHKAEYYLDLIQSFECNMQVTALAEGTADASTKRLLGLTDNEKVVIFSVIRRSRTIPVIRALEWKFKTIKDGKGVACTVPIDSVIGKLIYGFLSSNRALGENK